MRWLDSIMASKNMNLSKLQEIEEDREAWHWSQGIEKSQTQLGDWTTTTTDDGQRSVFELSEENTGTEKYIKPAPCSSEEVTCYLQS